MALRRPTKTGGTLVPWSDWYIVVTRDSDMPHHRWIVRCTTRQQIDRVLKFVKRSGGEWLRPRVYAAVPYYSPSRVRVRDVYAVNFLEWVEREAV